MYILDVYALIECFSGSNALRVWFTDECAAQHIYVCQTTMNELRAINSSIAKQIDGINPISIRDSDGYTDIFLDIYDRAISAIPILEDVPTSERHIKFTLLAKARVKKLHVITGERNVTSVSLSEICNCNGIGLSCYPIEDAI